MSPLNPPASLIIKLGSALVHADEFTSPGGDSLDLHAFRSLLADPEVVDWLDAMNALAFLPVKRGEQNTGSERQ